MKNGRNYWAGHVEAIKSQGVSTSAYLRQGYWQPIFDDDNIRLVCWRVAA